MKKIVVAIVLIFAGTAVFAQAANDRRGFQGTVTSGTKETVRHEGQNTSKDASNVTTAIQFTARTIVIEGETYDIVKKEFDGKTATTFTCTKRRSTFTITFKPGDSITVVDESNPSIETVYRSLAGG